MNGKSKQKSFSKTFNVGYELSDDGLLWFEETLANFSKLVDAKNPAHHIYSKNRIVEKKFKITLTEI